MPISSPFRVRFAIVGIFSVLALGFLLSPGSAQPGRPPGSIGGRPPGSITGMPGGPGVGGGISGMPGRPPGSITGMPGGISGIGGGGIGGIGGGPGITTYSWSCGKCGAHLGTTTTPSGSGQTRCPVCGVNFVGTSIAPGGGGFGAMPSSPPPGGGSAPAPAPGGSPPTDSAPPLPTNPDAGGSVTPSTPAPAPAGPSPSPPATSSPPESSSSTSDSSSSSGGRSKTIKLIGIVCGAILLIGALAALGVVVANANAAKPTRRPKRRRLDDDD